eukprot:703777-Alexandrium_andersonii.AAC.1
MVLVQVANAAEDAATVCFIFPLATLAAAPNCSRAKARVAGAAISFGRRRRTTRRPPCFGHLG